MREYHTIPIDGRTISRLRLRRRIWLEGRPVYQMNKQTSKSHTVLTYFTSKTILHTSLGSLIVAYTDARDDKILTKNGEELEKEKTVILGGIVALDCVLSLEKWELYCNKTKPSLEPNRTGSRRATFIAGT